MRTSVFLKSLLLFVLAALTLHAYLSLAGLAPAWFDRMTDQAVYFVAGLRYQHPPADTHERESSAAGKPVNAPGIATGTQRSTKESSSFIYGDEHAKPVKIVIEKIGVQADIIVPTSTAVSVLDEALLDGVVYYPGSGRLGDPGNMFLFAHSSWLPHIRNQNFAIFNDLRKLTLEDRIVIYSNTRGYIYEVTAIKAVSKEEAWVDFSQTDESLLTLSSCNTFGKKQDRVVVEAELIDTL